jgi:type II secretion system protein G
MRNRKGFTLIELMIVIAIIGILAAMAVPNFKKAREQAREKACYSNIRVLMGAVEMYNMDNSTMMSDVVQSDLISGQYIRTLIKCPENGDGSEYKATGSLYEDGQIKCNTKHGLIEGVE